MLTDFDDIVASQNGTFLSTRDRSLWKNVCRIAADCIDIKNIFVHSSCSSKLATNSTKLVKA